MSYNQRTLDDEIQSFLNSKLIKFITSRPLRPEPGQANGELSEYQKMLQKRTRNRANSLNSEFEEPVKNFKEPSTEINLDFLETPEFKKKYPDPIKGGYTISPEMKESLKTETEEEETSEITPVPPVEDGIDLNRGQRGVAR